MLTVKDLFENEELMENIVEDLDDLPEETEVIYAVWAIGYDKDDEITDHEYLIREFNDLDEALTVADGFTLEKLIEEFGEQSDSATAYFSIEVETVVADPADEDGCTMNLGTVYHRELQLDKVEEEEIVTTCAGDYELLDDGTLKLKAEFMKGFNKNDIVRVKFIDEDDTYPLPYKIVSKVIYEDGDYYHCELMI